MFKRLTLLFLLFFNCALAQTGDGWELKENNNGVKIYTRDIETSKIKAIKVECQLDATLSQVVSALMDVRNSEEWLYHTAGNTIIKQVSPSELYYYSLVEMPWPVSNRDFIAHLKVSQDAFTKVVIIDAPCVADMVPVKPKVVRIANSKGKWVLSPSGKGQVKVVYTLHADPGGSIPAWITNLFVTQGPSQSFKKLKMHLQKQVYKNAKLDYIAD
ncbi:START domain-containing protein [Mucilaginibacter sp.]|uniref:START domain-containing protein n=1 Tax=Mucilaginibacter sp. TaxID=1882438 RepID=UPI0026328736|nr:START domain-containing protein [Mucilaginibacter sp.]MDB5030077.1 lipid-binding protein [Mucilaginibacter sp.]